MILDESIKALISYRLESAREKLSAAEDLFEKRHYKDSVSRSYYAIFTAARALLATKRLDSSKHSGVIALFNQHFVKSGEIRKDASKWLERAKLYTVSKQTMVIFISYPLTRQKLRFSPPGNLLRK